jgi:hypothetical protein
MNRGCVGTTLAISFTVTGFIMLSVGLTQLPTSIPLDHLDNTTNVAQALHDARLNHPAFPLTILGGILEVGSVLIFTISVIYIKFCQPSRRVRPLVIRIPETKPDPEDPAPVATEESVVAQEVRLPSGIPTTIL